MSDKYSKFRNLASTSKEEALKLLDEAPDVCPLLGFKKCEGYYFNEGIVYLSNPSYCAYTIPEWNPNTRDFSYYEIDMENYCSVTKMYLELDELLEGEYTVEKLERLYGIKIYEGNNYEKV